MDNVNKKVFLDKFEQKLRAFYEKQTEYGKFNKEEVRYIEGFMHAGIAIKLVTPDEMKQIMEAIYFDVFKMTPLERKLQKMKGEQQETDWSYYDLPPQQRK